MQFLGLGNGQDGAYLAITGIFNPGITTFFGTANALVGGLGGSQSWPLGTLVLIHQTRGDGAGQYEINQVSSIVGTTINFTKPLSYTYSTSGNSRAQIMKIPQYSSFKVPSGVTLSVSAWNGSIGGILKVLVSGQVTIEGAIYGTGKGFAGGLGYTDGLGGQNILSVQGYSGEGTLGPSTLGASTSPNGNGAGAGGNGTDALHCTGGSGGSNGSPGTSGEMFTAGNHPGSPGDVSGNAELTNMNLGGGGSGGTSHSGAIPTNGGYGGSIIDICGKNITITGSIITNGVQGVDPTYAGTWACGGGGAGGSIFLKGHTIHFGTNLSQALGARGGLKYINNPNPDGYGSRASGGNGGNGRIRVEACTITGVTIYPSVSKSQGGFDFCGSLASILE